LAKKTLLLILIGEIDLDFVFLISVHCMLQSSGGSNTLPASFVRRNVYPSPPAKRHCPGIDPAASAVPPPPPPPPPPQGSGGDGPSRQAPSPSPSPPQGHAEEPLRFSERTTASGLSFRCLFCPDAMEMDNMYRLIEHALNFNPNDPSRRAAS